MGKVCVACGAGIAEPKKPMNEAEDCPGCGGEGTVKAKDEGATESGSEEQAEGGSDEG